MNVHRLGEKIYFLRIFMFFMIVHFIFNFLGIPLIKYSGAIIAIVAFLGVIFLRWDQAFYLIILYSIVGGQIKIVWGYQPFFRLCADFMLVILVFRNFVQSGKLVNFSKIPNMVVWLLFAHILWFMVALFNPLGAGFVASLATGKFYILPIFYFFALLNYDFDITSRLFKDFLKIYLFFIVLEALLVLYQSTMGPEFMYGISAHYASLFKKYELFSTAASFRPWGTSYVPGGYSTFFYLSTSFLFLWTIQPGEDKDQNLNTLKKVFIFIFITLSLFAVFISQVRAAFLKELIIIGLSLCFSLLGTQYVAKRIVGFVVGVTLFLGLGIFGLSNNTAFSEFLTIDRVVQRYEAIGSVEKASSQRISLGTGLSAVGQRILRPLGLGLGMTTNYLKDYGQKRKENINIHQDEYWHFDNFFAYLATELGPGSLFLIFTVLSIPLIIASFMIKTLKTKNYVAYRTTCYCFISIATITIGQWGAVGIIYPPEFKYYWFYVALAFGAFYRAFPKDKISKNLS